MKDTEKNNEPRNIKWWLQVIIAVLSAIVGTLGGTLVIAPFIQGGGF